MSALSRAFPPGGGPLETLVDSVTSFPRKRNSSGGAIWLRTMLVGVVLALLVPALAMAETTVAQEPATAEAAAAPAAAEPTPEAPAADPATPVDTTAPGDTTAPADTATPAPPPSTGTSPVSPPTLVELQPGTAATTTPTTTAPAASAPVAPSVPTVPEALPAALPTAPDAPRAEAPKPIAAPVPDQSTEALPTAQSASLAVALGSGPDASGAAAAAAAAKNDRDLRSNAAAAAAAKSIQSAGFSSPISLERPVSSVIAPPTRRDESRADFGQAAERQDNPFQVRLEAQGGPAPVGSSLLAVLASYVLPGGGSLPIQSTLFLFVQLAVILAFALAPRPGSGERLVLWGLLRSQPGHRLAVRRPG